MRPKIYQLIILLISALTLMWSCRSSERNIFLGMGAKSGEITSETAIVHVRLTGTAGQDADGQLPGKKGEVRLIYANDSLLTDVSHTGWRETIPANDYSVQFRLQALSPASRYYYRVEMRETPQSSVYLSGVFSFETAPAESDRTAVTFQVTTGQDLLGVDTYRYMAAQHPEFLVSTGDNVYYDQQCDARTVEEAYRCYQIMYGSRSIVDYFRHVGGYFEKDDHDYRFNDADSVVKGKWINRSRIRPGVSKITAEKDDRVFDEAWLSHQQGIEVFKKVFPMSQMTYRTFRWGKGIQIWLLEGRDYRSPNAMPDGPDKTIWGEKQKVWLKTTLLESDADYKIIISPTPVIGPDRQSKRDNHANRGGFWTEGHNFLNWLSENHLKNVSLVCGDRHWQYHSVYNGFTHEFSCGPTCDEHSVKEKPGQHPPAASEFKGVTQPYVKYCGGFLTVYYKPDNTLTYVFYDKKGEELYSWQFSSH